MSFDLRIRFTGLMMWVPEGEKAMHVLLPATPEHVEGGGGKLHEHPEEEMPPHFARLAYDAAYELPRQTQLSREYVMVDLKRGDLDLTGVTSSDGIEVRLPDELASLDAVAQPVDRKFVEGDLDPALAARVTMHAGAVTDYDVGIAFKFPSSHARRITPSTEWTIRGIAPATEGPEGLDGLVVKRAGGDEPISKLYPIGGTIHLMVMHLVAEQSLPHDRRFNPCSHVEDEHFHMYYEIAEPISKKPPIPGPAKLRKPWVTGAAVPIPAGGTEHDCDEEQEGHAAQESRTAHDKEKKIALPGSICGSVQASLA